MIDRHNQLLLDCRLSGQVPDSAWSEHLKDPEFAKFVASEMGPGREPEPTLGSRERACIKYIAALNYRSVVTDSTAHEAFKAGWNARKQLDYETALGIKR